MASNVSASRLSKFSLFNRLSRTSTVTSPSLIMSETASAKTSSVIRAMIADSVGVRSGFGTSVVVVVLVDEVVVVS
jgi:hypothetical protein